MSDPAIIEAAERALQDCASDYDAERLARKVLTAVTPMIEAAALERAAKVAEDEDGNYSWAGEHRNMALLQEHSRELAAAIRALKK